MVAILETAPLNTGRGRRSSSLVLRLFWQAIMMKLYCDRAVLLFFTGMLAAALDGRVRTGATEELLALDDGGRFLALERTWGPEVGMVMQLFELSVPAGAAPLFGQSILRSFVEAYWILAGMLVKRGWRPIAADEEAPLIDGALALGREMLLRREISTEAALSRPLFASALRLARHRRLLDADDPGVVQRREAFAADVQRHLDDRPVEAGPPSAVYTLRKFARRHRAVCTTAGGTALALLAGLVVSLVMRGIPTSTRVASTTLFRSSARATSPCSSGSALSPKRSTTAS